jgi:hypothetical protein
MAKRLAFIVVVVLLVVLLLPALGMAMAISPCPMCGLPTTPIGAMCLAILGTVVLLATTTVGRSFAPLIDRQPTGPPGPRLFRPPRPS